MIEMCSKTGATYIVPHQERGGFYIDKMYSKPPIEKCPCCGHVFKEGEITLYITGSNTYDHVCHNSSCVKKLERLYRPHFRNFFIYWTGCKTQWN